MITERVELSVWRIIWPLCSTQPRPPSPGLAGFQKESETQKCNVVGAVPWYLYQNIKSRGVDRESNKFIQTKRKNHIVPLPPFENDVFSFQEPHQVLPLTQ
jgi:hypothetical protein